VGVALLAWVRWLNLLSFSWLLLNLLLRSYNPPSHKPSSLFPHFHHDLAMGLVSLNYEIFHLVLINRLTLSRNRDRWEGLRRSLNLFLKRIEVIVVDVSVTQKIYKLMCYKAAVLRKEMSEE
jgi:hypothetical protein